MQTVFYTFLIKCAQKRFFLDKFCIYSSYLLVNSTFLITFAIHIRHFGKAFAYQLIEHYPEKTLLKNIYYILILCVLCSSCGFKLKSNDNASDPSNMKVERYDRLESRYVVTGDFSALQQMNTEYPIETRTLVEKILRIGDVSNHDISEQFLRFYQDSTLQTLVSDVELEYANMDDINQDLQKVFTNLKKWIPDMPLPHVYAQIGALDQSIVVGNRTIGISLDKYMGAKYHIYEKFGYRKDQLEQMNRSYIVPDCTLFYLLSLYPMDNFDTRNQLERDLHMGKMMWVTNKALGTDLFRTEYVQMINRYMKKHGKKTIKQLLESDDYKDMK